MTPYFRPRYMSATHVPSSTERLMNPFYHSQVKLPPYRARYLQRFHPYPRGSPSRLPGWARDDRDFDLEWDEFLEMADAFQRLNMDSIPRHNNAYTFPDHAANGEQEEPQETDDLRAVAPNAVDTVSAETQTIGAVDVQRQRDSNGVIEDSFIVIPTGGDGGENQGDGPLETGSSTSHVLQEAASSSPPVGMLREQSPGLSQRVGVIGV
ncbi:hypothetical protein PLEOSDRAFT_1101515 [Pleurotus ostreatus PC15]|uniref:Uncharacterized protein n=1 Tax=Pleurotus ostreatus (strain PC15) TaxID=1137138 RepID=A0A067P3R7_PLEO1|nr:hypothetical protein PLEOSDRAFT_1101515 [Pleurotus ostreatus PC15]